MKQIRTYRPASSKASGGVERIRRIGFLVRISSAVTSTEKTAKMETAAPIFRPASRASFAPTAFPIDTVAPIASPTIMTVSICISWEPMATAEIVEAPLNRPVMNRSARP